MAGRSSASFDYEVTLAVIGDSGTGKYSLISKFSHPEVKTIARGMDHDVFEHRLARVQGKTVKIHIFCPHAGYRTDYTVWTTLQPPITGALLVYDLTDYESLCSLKHRFTELYNHVGEEIKTILVGNKKDMREERMVDQQVALLFAKDLGCLSYVETSAMLEESVEKPFINLIEAVLGLDHFEEEITKKTRHFTVGGHLSSKESKTQRKEESHSKTIKELKQTIKSLQQQVSSSNKQMKELEQEFDQKLYRVQQENDETLRRYQQASESTLKKMRQVHDETLKDRIRDLNLQTEQTVRAIQEECEERVRQAMENVRTLEQRVERQASAQEDSKHLWVLQKEEIEMTDKILGSGGWGVVKVAKFRGLKVAAKCIHNMIITAYNRAMFIREMNIAARVRHPYLVQFIGATIEGAPILLTELMDASLRELLEKETQFTKEQIISIFQNIGMALNYLHLMKPDPIIHRDVSSANVLLERSSGNTVKAKLSDYGSANFIKHVKTAAPGSPAYAAPESLTPKLQSPKMDVFSYGVLMTEVFLCEFPDPAKREEMVQNLEKKYPSIARLAKQCLQVEPKERPTMSHILANL